MKKQNSFGMIVVFIIILMSNIHVPVYAQDILKPEIQIQTGHNNDGIQSIVYSTDGKYIVSCGYDKNIILWDAASGREIRKFIGHTANVCSVAISPDMKFIISAGSTDRTARLWNLDTGQEIRQFQGQNCYIFTVAISPDGNHVLIGGDEGNLSLFEISTGKEIRKFKGHNGDVISIAFSHDGKYALSGGGSYGTDYTIHLWEISTGNQIKQFTGHKKSISSISFSPDDKLFASCSFTDPSIIIWDVSSGKKIREIKTGNIYLKSISFSPNGKYLACNASYVPHLFDINSGKEIISFNYQDCDVIVPVTDDSNNSNKEYKANEGSSINAVDYAPDGRYILTGYTTGTIRIWDTVSGKLAMTLKTNLNPIYASSLSPESNLVLSEGKAGKLKLWDIATGKMVKRFNGFLNSGYGNKIVFSKDGNYALTFGSGNLLFIDIKSGEVKEWCTYDKGNITSIALSPDGKYALSSYWAELVRDNLVRLWDTSTGNIVKTIPGGDAIITYVVFSSDGRYAFLGDAYGVVHQWEIEPLKEIKKFKSQKYSIFSLSISPDEQYISAGSKNDIFIWNSSTGSKISKLTGHTGIVTSVCYSSDGKFIISGSKEDRTIRIWDISSGKEIKKIETAFAINDISISKDGKTFVTSSDDGVLRTWDFDSGTVVSCIYGFTDGEWVVMTPEGYYNASPNGDKYINVRIGNNVYGVENYREAFFRPDLVQYALNGGNLKNFASIDNVKQPPVIAIIDTPTSINAPDLTLKIKLTDQGGGIGDVRILINGATVQQDSVRGLKPTGEIRSYKLKLLSGENTIKVIAFNETNTMMSNAIGINVTANYQEKSGPSFYALVIGINKYKNPKLELKYAVPDADLFATTLETGAKGLFDNIKIKKLTSSETTTKMNIENEINNLKSLRPDDVFILYIASHGTVDDGEYFMLTSNVGATSTEKLKMDALSASVLKSLVANIPCTKKLIIIDTCNAEALADVMQLAMLTRGMSEDTAVKLLSRAVGATIISSSSSSQEAIEGYKGHGLFTWVLVEGLKGKAISDGTGYLKTSELADYVEAEVPELAEKVYNRKQYPTKNVSGQSFPIVKVGK